MDKQRIRNHVESLLAELNKEAAIESQQPNLDASYELLNAMHKHGDTYIDLYGTYDAADDEYDVLEFTLAGSLVPLWDLQPHTSNILDDLTNWMNDNTPSAASKARALRMETMIDALEDRKNEQ
jgi:hypothetical protein